MHSLCSISLAVSLLASCTFDTSTEVAEEVSGQPLEPTGATTQSETLGGSGGSPFGPIECPAGSVLVGLDGDFYEANDNGAGFCEVRAVCAKLLVSGSDVVRSATELAPVGGALGDCGQNRKPLEAMLCPDDGVVVGLSAVRSGLYQAITEIELRCGALDSTGFIFNRAYGDVWGGSIGMPGNRRTADCTDPSVATGIYGGVGIVLDSLGLQCQRLAIQN